MKKKISVKNKCIKYTYLFFKNDYDENLIIKLPVVKTFTKKRTLRLAVKIFDFQTIWTFYVSFNIKQKRNLYGRP